MSADDKPSAPGKRLRGRLALAVEQQDRGWYKNCPAHVMQLNGFA